MPRKTNPNYNPRMREDINPSAGAIGRDTSGQKAIRIPLYNTFIYLDKGDNEASVRKRYEASMTSSSVTPIKKSWANRKKEIEGLNFEE